MSTGENINANGAPLTQDMVRKGFVRFPQTDIAWVNYRLWPQIAPLQIAHDYPFKAMLSTVVPNKEVWFVDKNGTLLGRLVNVLNTAVPPPTPLETQDDSLDFVDDESDQGKVKRQKDRRIKDRLL
jgi:hypothetical protein